MSSQDRRGLDAVLRRAGTGLWYGYVILVVLFLMIPVLSLVIASFYDGQTFALPYEFTVRWYGAMTESSQVRSVVSNSIRLTIPVTIIAGTLGSLAAIGYTRYDFRGQKYFKLFALMPIFFPLMLLGLAMSIWTNFVGLGTGYWPTVIGQVAWIAPVVMFVVTIRSLSINPNLEEAARDLGASTLQMYKDVTIPLILDGILSGYIFALILSWNNYYITSYLSGSMSTITTWMQGRISVGYAPHVSALAATIFYITFIAVFIALGLEYRAYKS
jgi:spermidine/putrescine transport system permease protein